MEFFERITIISKNSVVFELTQFTFFFFIQKTAILDAQPDLIDNFYSNISGIRVVLQDAVQMKNK